MARLPEPVVGADSYENIALVTKMNKVFAFSGTEHIALPRRGLSPNHGLRQSLAHAEAPHSEEKRSAVLLRRVHPHLLGSDVVVPLTIQATETGILHQKRRLSIEFVALVNLRPRWIPLTARTLLAESLSFCRGT
jgi:hypothetical protein